MLEAFAGNLAFTYGTLARRAGRRWRRSDRLSLADGGVPFAFVMNMVVPLGPLPAGQITEAAEAFYGGRGYHVWSMWPIDGANGAGLEPLATNPVMIRPVGAHQPPPTDLQVVEARDAAGMAMFERTVKAAFASRARRPPGPAGHAAGKRDGPSRLPADGVHRGRDRRALARPHSFVGGRFATFTNGIRAGTGPWRVRCGSSRSARWI